MKKAAFIILFIFFMLNFSIVKSQNTILLSLPDLCAEARITSSPTEALNFFDISPNPSKGLFLLTLSGMYENEKRYISIIDIHGKTIWRETMEPLRRSFSLDLSDRPNGFYLIQVKDKNSLSYKKLLLQK